MKLAKVSTSHIQAVTGTTFVATMSSLLFGYATAVIAGVVGAIDHNFIAPRVLSNTAADALLEEKVARIDAAVAGAQARLDRVVSEARRPELEVKGPAPRGDGGGFADYMRSGFGLEVKAGLSTASNSAAGNV